MLKGRRVPPEAVILGANLRRLRHASGYSQKEVGRKLNITFQQVQKYESGKNRLPVEKLYYLRHLFGVSYEMFFIGFPAPDLLVHRSRGTNPSGDP